MAKDNDTTKDPNDSKDEDLLGFDFDEDLLGEEGEGKEKEEEIIDLVDIVEEGRAPELVEEDLEGLEELLSEEEEVTKKEEPPSEEEKKVAEGVPSEEAQVKEDVDEAVEGEELGAEVEVPQV